MRIGEPGAVVALTCSATAPRASAASGRMTAWSLSNSTSPGVTNADSPSPVSTSTSGRRSCDCNRPGLTSTSGRAAGSIRTASTWSSGRQSSSTHRAGRDAPGRAAPGRETPSRTTPARLTVGNSPSISIWQTCSVRAPSAVTPGTTTSAIVCSLTTSTVTPAMVSPPISTSSDSTGATVTAGTTTSGSCVTVAPSRSAHSGPTTIWVTSLVAGGSDVGGALACTDATAPTSATAARANTKPNRRAIARDCHVAPHSAIWLLRVPDWGLSTTRKPGGTGDNQIAATRRHGQQSTS